MSHARNLRIAIGFTFSCSISAMSHAQERIESPNPARPQPAVNRAAAAVRREAEAGIKLREKEFARLKAHPPAPLELQHVVIQVVNANRAGAPFPVNMRFQRGRVPIWLAPIPARNDLLDDDEPSEPQLLVAPEAFDFNLFGSTGDVHSARTHLETMLTSKIDAIDRMSHIAAVQKKKLLLAGRGDIKRLIDRIEDERKTFEQVRTDLTRCEEFLTRLEPLRWMIFHGPFGPDSLLSKTLNKMRDEKNLVTREPILELRAPGR
jgi:hypothetical protein